MLGLFGTLSLAARSLQAQQTGAEVAGQNLSNINNPAYARQRVKLQTAPTINTVVGPEGSGVQVVAIEQVRNALLDGQIRDETSVGSYWNTQQTDLGSTQTALDEFLNQSATSVTGSANAGDAAGTKGLSAQLTALFNAFQSVAANPSSLAERQALVIQAQTLAGTFNQASSALSDVSDSLDTSITDDVTSANQLLSEIADLNQQITIAEAGGGGKANDLRDLREQKLEDLAKFADFQATTAADGSLTLTLDHRTFVSGGNLVSSLGTFQGPSGLLVLSTTDNAQVDFMGGSLQAEIDVRNGPLAALRTGLDTLANQLSTQVNAVYSPGYDLNGNTGANFFTGSNAADIGVSAAIQNDPSLVQAAGASGAAGDNSVALALAQLANAKQAGLNNLTFSDAYGSLVTSLGNALSSANDQVANHTAVSNLLLKQRDSVSGVSMEEEMTNLVTFQKAYQASARIISVIEQMIDEVLNMKR